jgi:hypothetical protein
MTSTKIMPRSHARQKPNPFIFNIGSVDGRQGKGFLQGRIPQNQNHS